MKRRAVIASAITAAGTLAGCVTNNDASDSTDQSKGDTGESTLDSTTETGGTTKIGTPESQKSPPTETDTDFWSDCGARSRVSVELPVTVPNGTTIHEYEASNVTNLSLLDDLLERASKKYRPGMEDDLEERKTLAASWSEGSFEEAKEIRNTIGYLEDFHLRYDDTVYVLRYSVLEC